jgi:membrane protein YdbS with pleckstrin-like domain
MAVPVPHASPRYLRSAYLATGESLLRETRGTALFYFPGPVLWLIILLFFDYSALNLWNSSFPAVPGLSTVYAHLSTYGSYAPGTYLLLIFLFLTLIIVLWLLVRYLRWISTVYAVTTSRVIIQRGIFSRDFDEIPILQVRGADVHQTIPQRILGYGTIVVSSEGGSRSGIGNESWKGIPRPFEFQRVLEAATQSLARNIAGGATPPSATQVIRPPGQM